MGSIYPRGSKLWFAYKDIDGRRKLQPSGLVVGQEEQARELLEKMERQITAAKRAGLTGPVTVRSYSKVWIEQRKTDGVGAAEGDESRFQSHILPVIGDMLLADIRPRHVRDFVRALRQKTRRVRGEPDGTDGRRLAPRTIRHDYFLLHRMLHDAVVDEHLAANPCVLKRGDLPAIVDADPEWRSGAVFARPEVESIISDERIPEDRRMFYSLLFLAGVRAGEASAVRWRHYDTAPRPLGRLLIAHSYNTHTKAEKGTKTNRTREVPVHPTLAKVLAAWKLSGWEAMMGRKPELDDLIIPSRAGRNRNVNLSKKRFDEDLERLKLRKRRQHDARRTFISLCLSDGARKDILRWVTHGATSDVVDLYVTLPWPALCEAVACLKIDLLEGKLLAMPRLAAVGDDS